MKPCAAVLLILGFSESARALGGHQDNEERLSHAGPARRALLSRAVALDASDPGVRKDMDTIRARRIDATVSGMTEGEIADWVATLSQDGKWPDSEIDYKTGCEAQRANWPAQVHWLRTVAMSVAYRYGIPDTKWANDASLRGSISSAMDWWFTNDFTIDACLDGGGKEGCPCGTPGLWNGNWFANVLYVPLQVTQACQLLNATLTPTQAGNCSHIARRAISPFYRPSPPGFVSGANVIEIAKVGIEEALRVYDASLLADQYERVHSQMVIDPRVKEDGIKPDGSFGQHLGLMYNGNYGKDYARSVLALEEAAAGTQFSADANARSAFGALFDADKWMIVYNTVTDVLHWDYSALSRFITFAVKDSMATGGININLTQVASVGEQWDSNILTDFAQSLSKNISDANAGQLVGNRMFWSNDYMVHRGDYHVTTVKMFSSRTKNSECTNSQNPLGFHLSDGASYTYIKGAEYEDIAGMWDWNQIPGTTVDYQATPLTCEDTEFFGKHDFVGGASDGKLGVAVMRYTNPYGETLSWQKAWFFLDNDVQYVTISNLTSKSDAPVYTVLDQKRRSEKIFADSKPMDVPSKTFSGIRSLWHDNVGYVFSKDAGAPNVRVETGERHSEWKKIGTSTQPEGAADLFIARLEHESNLTPTSYTVYPATGFVGFLEKRRATRVHTVQNDDHMCAVWDDVHGVAMVVFWDSAGGYATFDGVTIVSSTAAVVIYHTKTKEVTVADPSQTLKTIHLDFIFPSSRATLDITLPLDGMAGSSVTEKLR